MSRIRHGLLAGVVAAACLCPPAGMPGIARAGDVTDASPAPGTAADKAVSDATGNAATGNAATGNAATGNAATGNAATGNAATGNAATGNAAIASDTVAGYWQSVGIENEQNPLNAIAVGHENGIPLYPCRGSYGGGVQLGRVRGDFHGCHIGYAGREVEVAPYEVLVASWIGASSGAVPAGARPAGSYPVLEAAAPFRIIPLVPCRTAWHATVQIGEVRDGGCTFGFGGRQVTMDSYEVLITSSWMTWVSAVPLVFDVTAIAGGNENGEPLYVCRAAAGGGLHVGKINHSALGCGVTDGRREVLAERFELLMPRWRTGSGGTLPVGAAPQGRENGMSQYICRAQRSNTVQIGKVSENQAGCHIGMQGGEAVATVYEVLGD